MTPSPNSAFSRSVSTILHISLVLPQPVPLPPHHDRSQRSSHNRPAAIFDRGDGICKQFIFIRTCHRLNRISMTDNRFHRINRKIPMTQDLICKFRNFHCITVTFPQKSKRIKCPCQNQFFNSSQSFKPYSK